MSLLEANKSQALQCTSCVSIASVLPVVMTRRRFSEADARQLLERARNHHTTDPVQPKPPQDRSRAQQLRAQHHFCGQPSELNAMECACSILVRDNREA
eukprot:5235200-Amphidinium_carterae.2